MDVFAARLHPNQDLKQSLQAVVATQQIQAGFILTAVGSLQQATLRYANQPTSEVLSGPFEIISLVGTLSATGAHLHLAIADGQGQVRGGHVGNGCIIYTTAEIVIGTSTAFTFSRQLDPQTGFQELSITFQNG